MIYMVMMYFCCLILCIENIIRLKIYFNYFNKIIRSVSLRTLIMNMEYNYLLKSDVKKYLEKKLDYLNEKI